MSKLNVYALFEEILEILPEKGGVPRDGVQRAMESMVSSPEFAKMLDSLEAFEGVSIHFDQIYRGPFFDTVLTFVRKRLDILKHERSPK